MWGEIVQRTYVEPEAIDISDVISQAQHPDCLSNYDIASRLEETREITLPTMESNMLYAAQLHSYKNSMKNIIDDAELAVEFNLMFQKPCPELVKPEKGNKTHNEDPQIEDLDMDVEPTLPIPVVKSENVKINPALQYVEKKFSDFTKGVKVNPPYLSEYTRKHVEKQCIATLLAQIGFSVSTDTVLDTMTDVLEEFYKNLCQQLRVANDALLSGRTNHFPDIVEQVFTQSGVGGLQGIQDYYENRVMKYENILEKQCDELSKKYDNLVMPDNIKVEKNNKEEDDIPEVHYTAIDGEEDYLQPFLEIGFQMLNSLEEGQFST